MVPMKVCYAYLTVPTMEGTFHERQLVRQISEVNFNVLFLSSFLRLVRYALVMRISYDRMMVGCEGNGMLLRVPVTMVDEWFAVGILCHIRNIMVDPVLALVAVACVTEMD